MAHKRDVTKMMRENVVLTNQLNDMRKNFISLSLKMKAIDESGILLGGPKNFGDLFEILGVKDPGEKLRKDNEKVNSHPNAGGIFATEGVTEMKENAPPEHLRSRTAGPRSPRTVGRHYFYFSTTSHVQTKNLLSIQLIDFFQKYISVI